MGTLRSLLPADSPINDFLDVYGDVKEALDAATAIGIALPESIAAPLAQAGVGLWGEAGTWAGAGPAQNYLSGTGMMAFPLAFWSYMGSQNTPSTTYNDPFMYYEKTSPLGANLSIQMNLTDYEDIADWKYYQDSMFSLDQKVKDYATANGIPLYNISTVLNGNYQAPVGDLARKDGETREEWVKRAADARWAAIQKASGFSQAGITDYTDIGYKPNNPWTGTFADPSAQDPWDLYYYAGGEYLMSDIPAFKDISIQLNDHVSSDEMFNPEYLKLVYDTIQTQRGL